MSEAVYELSTMLSIGGTNSQGNFGGGVYMMLSPWDTPSEVALLGVDADAAATLFVSLEQESGTPAIINGESGWRGMRFDTPGGQFVPCFSDWISIPESRLFVTVQAAQPTTHAYLSVKWRRLMPRAGVFSSNDDALAAISSLLDMAYKAGVTDKTYSRATGGEQWNADEQTANARRAFPFPWNPRKSATTRTASEEETERANRLASGRPDLPKTHTGRRSRG